MPKIDPIQLELPIELKALEKYKNIKDTDVYKLSRHIDSGTVKDFICAVPKNFKNESEYDEELGRYVYKRERVYLGENGQKFTKRYILKGYFKEYDEEERTLLTNYWKVTDGQNIQFHFYLSDYLNYKGVYPSSGANQKRVLDFIKRVRSNEWSMNYLFDYEEKKFDKESGYGIIQKYDISSASSSKKQKKTVIEITWTQDYFNRIKKDPNWKKFNINNYVSIPEQSGIARKLLLFLAQGNNEFIESENEQGYNIKIEIETLCDFYLAVPKKNRISEYKKILKKPLLMLSEKGLLGFDELENCFLKEKGFVFVTLFYTPHSYRVLKQVSLPLEFSFRTREEELYFDLITKKDGLLDQLGKSQEQFEKYFLKTHLLSGSFEIKNVSYNLAYVIWGNLKKVSGKALVTAPKKVFQMLMGIEEEIWDIQPEFQVYWKQKIESKIHSQIEAEERRKGQERRKKEEMGKLQREEEAFKSLSIIEKFDYLISKYPVLHEIYMKLDDDFRIKLKSILENNSSGSIDSKENAFKYIQNTLQAVANDQKIENERKRSIEEEKLKQTSSKNFNKLKNILDEKKSSQQ